VLISELSGVSNISTKVGRKFKIEEDKAAQRAVLEQVQNLENEGFQFEAAEASFELLLRKQIGKHHPFFKLEQYRVEVVRRDNEDPTAEATVKLKIGETVEHRVAEGDGPIAAIDVALRKALKPHYPAIDQLHLIDYKVRVINSKDETSAKVRVVIEWRRTESPETKQVFGTIGVSGNIIDASWQALVDAYEYHLLHVEEASATHA